MSAIGSMQGLPLALLGATREELCARAAPLPGGRGLAEALHRRAFREGCFEPEAALPLAQAAAWREALAFDLPRVVRRESEGTSTGLVEKAVLADAQGLEIECVRMSAARWLAASARRASSGGCASSAPRRSSARSSSRALGSDGVRRRSSSWAWASRSTTPRT
jgi:hypothetical protein